MLSLALIPISRKLFHNLVEKTRLASKRVRISNTGALSWSTLQLLLHTD